MDLGAILLAVTLVNLAGWASPGPNMAAVASVATGQGWRKGATVGLGVASAGLIWAVLAMLGVSGLFQALPALFLSLKLAGGAYLIWLGLRRVQATTGAIALKAPRRLSGLQAFRLGCLVMLTNPKAVLFYGAVLAAIVPQDAPFWLMGLIIAWSQLMGAVLHGATAAAFSTRFATRAQGRAGLWIDRGFGGVFIALGAGVLWQSLRRA